MPDQFQALVAGVARGNALVLTDPLSLWGGLDPDSGAIIDAHHPHRGIVITGHVLVMPFGRGSSSSASTLLEAVRLRTHPTAILLAEPDEILMLGAIVARALYAITLPVAVVPRAAYDSIRTGDVAELDENRLTVSRDGRDVMTLDAVRRASA